MKIFFFMSVLFVSLSTYAQKINPQYDSVLAQKYKGDENGMKMYVLVMLKTGSNTTTDKAFIDSCFTGHMNNIGRLAKEGKLIVAGPLAKNPQTYRGIFIFDTKDIEEARIWVMTDPAVSSRLLDAELFNWYGSAALPAYIYESEKVWKQRGF
ncbi:MAG TPA: hypothetical protein DHV17_01360 [Chitinophagaceae bacterium]|nr:hypothetical protein [Chitinophagaceae bacterium]